MRECSFKTPHPKDSKGGTEIAFRTSAKSHSGIEGGHENVRGHFENVRGAKVSPKGGTEYLYAVPSNENLRKHLWSIESPISLGHHKIVSVKPTFQLARRD